MAQGSSNPTTDLKKIAGTATDVNTGNATAGTQRVVLASNQPVIPVGDNGTSLTVDAPATAPVSVRLSNGTTAVDTLPVSLASVPSHPVTNAGTFAVQVSTALPAGTNNIGDVDVLSLPALPTGANTIGNVNVNGTVPVSGTFWQATQPVSLASLPTLAAGTNNIGDVDVASLPGTVATDITAIKTATELLDNSVGTDGTATATGMIRVGGTDGTLDQVISVTSAGLVNIADGGGSITVDGTVAVSGSVAVTGPLTDTQLRATAVPVSGTFWQATQPVSLASLPTLAAGTNNIGDVDVASLPGTVATDITAIKTGVELLDNAVNVHDAVASTTGLQVSGFASTTAPTAVVAGDSARVWTTLNGAVNVADGGSTLSIDDGAGSITVDGTVAATQSGTWNIGSITTLPSIPAGTNNIGDVDVLSLPALPAGTNNIGDVDVASLPGTVATDITAIKTATELLDNAVGTDGAATATGMLRVGGTDGTNDQVISVTSAGLVNIADGGGSITVDGTVAVSGSVAVTGTFWQATQPVSGPLTDTQLRATAVPVSLASVPSHAVTNAGTFAVQVSTALPAGANNIGDVDVLTLPAIPAGTNTIGAVYNRPIVSGTTYQPSNATTTVYASSLVVKASAGALYAITGYSSRTSAQFIQVFNSTTLPADGTAPVLLFRVPADGNFSLDLTPYGRYFSTGIVVCNSTTGPTKTIGAADCWFDVQFL